MSLRNEESRRLIKYYHENKTVSLQSTLPSNKACILNKISVKIIKLFSNVYFEKLKGIFNKFLQENKFPDLLKKVEISPAF